MFVLRLILLILAGFVCALTADLYKWHSHKAKLMYKFKLTNYLYGVIYGVFFPVVSNIDIFQGIEVGNPSIVTTLL